MCKKYYCPYCGSRTLRIGQKINIGATFTNTHKKCSSCGNFVSLSKHWIVYFTFCSSIIALLCSVFFLSYVFLALFTLLYISYDIASVLFTKFTKRDVPKIVPQKYVCFLESSPRIKFPQMFFSGNSVLEIESEHNRHPVNIELVNENQVVFSFIDDNIELSKGIVTFFDGNKIIGRATIE